METGPRIYNLFPPMVGPASGWAPHLPRIAAMGFDWVWINPIHYPGFSGSLYAIKDFDRLNPLFGEGDPDQALADFADAARGHGLKVMMDLVANHTSKDALLTAEHPEWYHRNPDGSLKSPSVVDPDDPTKVTEWGDLAEIDYGDPAHHPAMIAWWGGLVRRWAELGVAGLRCDAAYKIPAEVWAGLIGEARQAKPDLLFAAETLGCPTEDIVALRQAGFDLLFNSAKWWDFHSPWLLEQYDLLRAIAPSVAFPESHDTERLAMEVVDKGDVEAWYRLRARFAAFFSNGWMMPMGYEWGLARRLDVVATRPEPAEPHRFDLSTFIGALNAEKVSCPALNDEGPQRRLTIPESPLVVLLRLTPDCTHAALLAMNTDWRDPHTFEPADLVAKAAPEAGRMAQALPERFTLAPLETHLWTGRTVAEAAPRPRAAAERAAGLPALREEVPLGPLPEVRAPGIVILNVAPSVDCGRWPVKREVGDVLEVTADILKDGHEPLQAHVLWRMEGVGGWHASPMALHENDRWIGRVPCEQMGRIQYTVEAWGAGEEATQSVRLGTVYEAVVERERARYGAWYEMMVRSQGSDPRRGATFREAERRLPEIARMGFDVLYLLPIHPIGRVNRKGPDNTLVAGEGDPGSPYAIGSDEGGHTAIHPELGTLDDFRRFRDRAAELGMELALDFAIQCAPDHPWVRQHPEWFRWRADGTIRYAENPPKKYQDIVNVDFHGAAGEPLWRELLGVVLFWVEEGVRIFRVDNPHTKPITFWEWLIRTVHAHHPDVVFLSEAFTRPKMMRALAKAGFSQSYTYFTWRNFKDELTDYLGELAHGEARDYMRPNFFPTTPDILPPYLQTGGRAAFRIRLVLAATLSPSYGLYNGYELCEAAGIPGKEEYLHSEKYQYKVWDWNRPGHIKDEIARLNAVRRDNPCFRELENLRFHHCDDEAVLFYGKDNVFVAVTLDPFDVRQTTLHLPFDEAGTFEVEELLTGERHIWHGPRQRIRLDPEVNPAAIFRVSAWTKVDYRTPCM